jgi:hypothetical protein
MKTVTLESCHSTWVFDTDHRRFRRVLRGVEVSEGFVFTQWRNYHRLEIDPHEQYFTVWLNAQGSRMLRSAIYEPYDTLRATGHGLDRSESATRVA